MATQIIPSVGLFSKAGIYNSTDLSPTAGSTQVLCTMTSDSWTNPTTATVVAVRVPQEGKVIGVITYCPASSLSYVRIFAQPGESSDGAWQGKVGSTIMVPIGYVKAGQPSTLGVSAMFELPETAKYGRQSTVNTGYQNINLMFDVSTAVGSTSSTLATLASTFWVDFYQIP